MQGEWNKSGVIFKPGDDKPSWMNSHAQNPFPEHKKDDVYRIHFSTRDQYNQAHGAFLDIDINDPKNILHLSAEPTIAPGALGCFDDCGVMPGCIVQHEGKNYMYYTGWSQVVKTPFTFYIGLAVSEDGGNTYERVSQAPVLGRNYYDPFLTASPWVMIDNNRWRMWYVSCVRWVQQGENKPVHYYHIRYAESTDGVNWKSNGTVCIDFEGDEFAIARPVVTKQDGKYEMWYCSRGGKRGYQLGFAESTDGIHWERKDDEVTLKSSPGEWDSDAVCYACPLKYKGKEYMFYNGNNYGGTGFGMAVRSI